MSDVEACRICLRPNSKYYRLDEYNLKLYFVELTSLPVSGKDGFLQYFCYECAALLYKFHRFRQKCYDAHGVLQAIRRSGPITSSGISKTDFTKIRKNQFSNLEVLVKSKRVRTYQIHESKFLNDDDSDSDANDNVTLKDLKNKKVKKRAKTREKVKVENGDSLKEDSLDGDCSETFLHDDDEHCKDPETDPVAENKEDFLLMKFEDSDNEKEETPDVLSKIVEEVDKLEQMVETEVEEKPEKKQKSKGKKKTTKAKGSQVSDRTRQSKRKKKETDAETTSVMSPTIKKNYKFNEPKKLKRLAFMDSGFWQKISLNEEEARRNFEAKAYDKKYLKAPYKCTDCYKGFSQKNMLERHIPLMHGEAKGKHVCRFCKFRFRMNCLAESHMTQHYVKYQCLRCDLVCHHEDNANLHDEYHNGVIWNCPHCNKEFKHRSSFYTHLRTHKSKHVCALCGESFVSEKGLSQHRKVKHLSKTEPPVKELPENMYCDICKIKFETIDAYDKHLIHSSLHVNRKEVRLDFMDEIPSNNPVIEEDKKEEGEEEGKTKKVSAKAIYTRYSTVEKTLSAVRKSLGRRKILKIPTTCYHCGQVFETQMACRKHHLATHPRLPFRPNDRVICEICGASLALGSVATHLNQHTRAKMFTCSICGRSFTNKKMLQDHSVTHTGERPYACKLCNKTFRHNGSLHLHFRTIHLHQPYPKRNRVEKSNLDIYNGQPE